MLCNLVKIHIERAEHIAENHAETAKRRSDRRANAENFLVSCAHFAKNLNRDFLAESTCHIRAFKNRRSVLEKPLAFRIHFVNIFQKPPFCGRNSLRIHFDEPILPLL